MHTPVSGTPRLLLRLEGLVVLVASIAAYAAIDGSWTLFALLLLVPDLAMIGYLSGPRVGAITYNAVHTYAAPALVGVLAYAGLLEGGWRYCLIWIAHIAMDRALGFGLKFSSAFADTHLGVAGGAGRFATRP